MPNSRTTAWIGLTGAIYWGWGLWYWPQASQPYDAVRQTISELGRISADNADLVNLAWSLPLGLWLSWAVHRAYRYAGRSAEARRGCAAVAGVGMAYAVCGLFPCDPGCPLWGSGRQLLHNAFGALEYLGGGAGLLIFSAAATGRRRLVLLLRCSGYWILLSLVLMAWPPLFPVRGLVQRGAELQLLGWLLWASGMQLAGGFSSGGCQSGGKECQSH